ncbi:MAG TPA: hypothetical protein VNN08_05795, partial [Thermoanaerobaculia bacterium]|nr:hypothetical protein [Thermoanaerobaculia bacterium]
LPAGAQSTRVLVPIVATGASGAFDSLWTSEVVAFNASTAPVVIDYSHRCDTLCIPGVVVHSSEAIDLAITPFPTVPAAFLYVPNESADAFEFGLRVRDVSRQTDSWGTEVPVVPESRAFQRPFDLLNVPLPLRFRQTLRIYDFEDKSGNGVRVQFFDMATGQPLKDFQMAMLPPRSDDVFTPAYGQLDQFGQAPELAGIDRIRVRISPTNATQRLWAMVSVTNNVTQELTMVTPQ